jgi:hypothetical protein
MEILAEYHVPAIMEKCQPANTKEEADSSKSKTESTSKTEEAGEKPESDLTSTSVASIQELSQTTEAKESEKGITPAEAGLPYWPDPMPPCTLHDCKTYMRFLIPAVKMVIHGVRNSHLTKCNIFNTTRNKFYIP